MNSSPPPTSHLQVPETGAEQLAQQVREALGRWLDRTRITTQRLALPFVSELLSRVGRG